MATIAELRKLPRAALRRSVDRPQRSARLRQAGRLEGPPRRRPARHRKGAPDRPAPPRRRRADRRRRGLLLPRRAGKRARPLYEAAQRTYDELGDKKGRRVVRLQPRRHAARRRRCHRRRARQLRRGARLPSRQRLRVRPGRPPTTASRRPIRPRASLPARSTRSRNRSRTSPRSTSARASGTSRTTRPTSSCSKVKWPRPSAVIAQRRCATARSACTPTTSPS